MFNPKPVQSRKKPSRQLHHGSLPVHCCQVLFPLQYSHNSIAQSAGRSLQCYFGKVCPDFGQVAGCTSSAADSSYSFKDVWVTTKPGENPTLSNLSIGLSFTADGEWRLQFGDLKHGNSVTSIEFPEIAGFKKPMVPVVTIISRLAQPVGSMEDLKKSLLRDFKSTSVSIDFCDRMNCEAYEVSAPFYPEEGGAHLFVIFMERSEPEYPGLIFEYPHDLPSDESSSEVKYYRAEAKHTRLKGVIRYAIVLDSCVSIYPEAKNTLIRF
jgi:hypothetical protein